MGLEPMTLCLEDRCSIQLSYSPLLKMLRSISHSKSIDAPAHTRDVYKHATNNIHAPDTNSFSVFISSSPSHGGTCDPW